MCASHQATVLCCQESVKAETRGSASLQNTYYLDCCQSEVVTKFIEMLTNPPILTFDLAFMLHTEPSNKELGAVLYQCQNNKLSVIGYWSCTLTPVERNSNLHSG